MTDREQAEAVVEGLRGPLQRGECPVCSAIYKMEFDYTRGINWTVRCTACGSLFPEEVLYAAWPH